MKVVHLNESYIFFYDNPFFRKLKFNLNCMLHMGLYWHKLKLNLTTFRADLPNTKFHYNSLICFGDKTSLTEPPIYAIIS